MGLATYQQVGDLLEDVDDFAGGLALVDGVELGGHGECVCGWGLWCGCACLVEGFGVDWRLECPVLYSFVGEVVGRWVFGVVCCGVCLGGLELELAVHWEEPDIDRDTKRRLDFFAPCHPFRFLRGFIIRGIVCSMKPSSKYIVLLFLRSRGTYMPKAAILFSMWCPDIYQHPSKLYLDYLMTLTFY